MEIELRHLRLIKALGETGSVSRAASALGASQPAISRQLTRIEHSLGAQLFSRGRSGVEPTSLGRLVLSRARAILPAVELLHSDAATLVSRGECPAQLRLGAHLGPAMVGLVEAVGQVAPRAQVVAESDSRLEALVDMVHVDTLDAATISEFVGFDIPLPPEMDRWPIGTEPVFVALAADHPLAAMEEVPLEALAEERWVIGPVDLDREFDVFASACEQVGFEPRIEHYLSGAAAAEFIRRGDYVGMAFPTALLSGMVTRPIAGSPLRVRHLLICSRQSYLRAHSAVLLGHVRQELAAARSQVPAYAAWGERHRQWDLLTGSARLAL